MPDHGRRIGGTLQSAARETAQIIDPLGAITCRLEVESKIMWLRPQWRARRSQKDRRTEAIYGPEGLSCADEPVEPGGQTPADQRIMTVRSIATSQFLDDSNTGAKRLWFAQGSRHGQAARR
jgi:hypothetical protein